MGSSGFQVFGLVWDTLPVVQNYNSANEPPLGDETGQDVLLNTHTTWNGVSGSDFAFSFGGTTNRCPSLVAECPRGQKFDGKNDFAWVDLGGPEGGFVTLGVTWFGRSRKTGPEADIALTTNPNVTWANDGVSDVDAETVALHENGHAAFVGHSEEDAAIMAPIYDGPRRVLHADDEMAIIYLYDSSITGSVSGTVRDDSGNAIKGATVALVDTSLSAKTGDDGTYTISGVPDPVSYDVTAVT